MLGALKLFNSVLIDDCFTEKIREINEEDYLDLVKETIPKGYIIRPSVYSIYYPYLLYLINDLKENIEKHIQVSYSDWNQSFYKSWEKIQNTPNSQKIVEQIIHYMTTYGFESVGIDSDFVYLPEGEIQLPELDESKLSLLYIKAITYKDVTKKIINIVSSGVALKEETQKDIIDVMNHLPMENKKEIIESSINKEFNLRIADFLNITPKNPTEFMRYIVYHCTGSTLLIQNFNTIETIRNSPYNEKIIDSFFYYRNEYGLEKLAESFYRYKDLYLAFRSNNDILKPVINRIRKLAKKYHKPMPEDFLNTITARLKKGEIIDFNRLKNELEKANNFRKARLLYAVKLLGTETTERVYTIRNGKSHVTKIDDYVIPINTIKTIEDIIKNSIIKSISSKVKGKTFLIPDNIKYALPATEKQFIGNIPSKSRITFEDEDSLVAGIHWKNKEIGRVDLDLSVVDLTGAKIGWDANYSRLEAYFSGDVTDAKLPNGASEFLYFGIPKNKEVYLMLVNFYNSSDFPIGENTVPFDFIIGRESKHNLYKNYLINPNKVLLTTKSEVSAKQKSIGLFIFDGKKKTFCFTGDATIEIASSYPGEIERISQKYLLNVIEKTTVDFNDLLIAAGATVTNDDTQNDIDYDWRHNVIDKNSFIDILG